MKFLIKLLLFFSVLGGIGYAAYPSVSEKIAERYKPRWRTETVKKGTITKDVNATGKVRPTKSVHIGSFVSGPITDLFVEFNQEVKQDEILARIDPRLFAANVARDQATLAARRAEVQRVEALLQQAVNDEMRAIRLRKKNKDFVSQTEMDQLKFNRMSLDAQIISANAAIDQAIASLTNSQANLDYCEIKSPEDGMIIDRKVEPGQTLAAQFQTPELFIVGVGMREKMHVFADVDESEIGMIRTAAEENQPVTFTVTAYPGELFKGEIEEVRYSAAELQNVVTYPVVVATPNPDLKLLPGMTADLSFRIKKLEDTIRIPKSALRFYPEKQHVREQDHHILDGTPKMDDGDDKESEEIESTSEERVDAAKKAKTRHVWVLEGELLKAIEVTVGLTDNQHAELLTGDVAEDTELIIGLKAAGEK